MSSFDSFATAVTQSGRARCWLCVFFPAQESRCRSVSGPLPMDPHHVIPKQRIKREFPHGAYVAEDGTVDQVLAAHRRLLAPNAREVNGVRVVPLDELLWDPRNGIPLRRWHHDEVEQARVRVPRVVLPAAAEEFAAEFELTWSLDRDYGERSSAA